MMRAAAEEWRSCTSSAGSEEKQAFMHTRVEVMQPD